MINCLLKQHNTFCLDNAQVDTVMNCVPHNWIKIAMIVQFNDRANNKICA